MPIRFRCGYCDRLLAIAKRKAGAETTCPHCGYTVTVPEEEYASEPSPQIEIVDLDEFSNADAPAQSTVTAPARPQVNRPPAAPLPAPSGRPAPAAERPLFDGNLDSMLGTGHATSSQPAPAVSPSGFTARTLVPSENQIVLSVQKATLLAIVGVILMGLSFAAGFLVASAR